MSYSLLFCPFGQQKKDTTFCGVLGFILLSCVPDIDVVVVPAGRFIPYPHVGDIRVVCISIQPAADVPLQAGAVRPGPDGVVPAVYCAALQPQAQALCAALRVAYPVADIEAGYWFWYGLHGCGSGGRRFRCRGWRLRGGNRCRCGRSRRWRGGGSLDFDDKVAGI